MYIYPPQPQWPTHGGVLWVTRDVLRQLAVNVDSERHALTHKSLRSACRFVLVHLAQIELGYRDHPLALAVKSCRSRRW
jgi:hypothetical protein